MSIIVGSLAELETYFHGLQESHAELKYFVAGDSHKITTVDRSSVEYPLLWMETPEVDWTLSDKYQRVYRVAFIVLGNVPPDNWRRERLVKSLLLDIVSTLLRWIQQDKEAGLLDYESLSARSQPVFPWGHDNEIGWRTELDFRVPISYCPEPCKQQSFCPAGTLAKFSWDNSMEGDFTNLAIVNLTTPDEDWEFEWTWYINDQPPETSTDETPVVNAAGDYILMILKITLDDCTKYASAFFTNTVNCGQSVPFLLSKSDC